MPHRFVSLGSECSFRTQLSAYIEAINMKMNEIQAEQSGENRQDFMLIMAKAGFEYGQPAFLELGAN